MKKNRMNRYATMLGISVISGQKFKKPRKKNEDVKAQINAKYRFLKNGNF